MQLSDQETTAFQEAVWDYYHQSPRSMPWRDNPNPYFVLVSELMLQQTQVDRVIPKFETFIRQFPSVRDLARAPLSEVLRAWNGLGYNRRAKFLHQSAQKIMHDFAGKLPRIADDLISLPGVGPNTAGAIMAYAYKLPSVFVETNIRTVYFYHFFASQNRVSDNELHQLVEQTLDKEQPREWYWALMDYGTHLKQTLPSNISQSRHYARQSKFEGSRRQLRGKVLRLLLDAPLAKTALQQQLPDPRLAAVLQELIQEGFVRQTDGLLRLADLP